jgi:ATP-dependent Clp protease adapter protein ClpS
MNATVNNFAAVAASLTSETKEPKAPNYTTEQTVYMVAAYLANKSQETVDRLALEMGKTGRSIIAKLSREKVYTKAVYKTKAGIPSVKKDEHAEAIASVLRLDESSADSLTKCNKKALLAIWEALAKSVPLTPENSKGSTPPMQRGESVGIADDSEFSTQ